MKSKHYRIQIMGSNSPQAYITIPMKWLRKHSLRGGDSLIISYDETSEDGKLVITIPTPVR